MKFVSWHRHIVEYLKTMVSDVIEGQFNSGLPRVGILVSPISGNVIEYPDHRFALSQFNRHRSRNRYHVRYLAIMKVAQDIDFRAEIVGLRVIGKMRSQC